MSAMDAEFKFVGQSKYDIESIPSSKLLNYVKKSDLIEYLTREKYEELENHLHKELNKERITLRDIKRYLTQDNEFMEGLRAHDLGANALEKYTEAADRLRNVSKAERERRAQVRKGLTQPRKRFKGCLATKIEKEDYQECLDNYDSEEYQNISLVPSALVDRVYHNTQDDALKQALEKTVRSRSHRPSDLPSGLRYYMKTHPSEFKTYYEERRHEMGLMRAIIKSLDETEKSQLRRFFKEKKRLTSQDFMMILGGPKEGSPVAQRSLKRKKVHGRGEEPRKPWADTAAGHMFDLDNRSDHGYVGSYAASDASEISSMTELLRDQRLY